MEVCRYFVRDVLLTTLQGDIQEGFDEDPIYDALKYLIFETLDKLGVNYTARFGSMYPIPAIGLVCTAVGLHSS
jgi:hypothetical protein